MPWRFTVSSPTRRLATKGHLVTTKLPNVDPPPRVVNCNMNFIATFIKLQTSNIWKTYLAHGVGLIIEQLVDREITCRGGDLDDLLMARRLVSNARYRAFRHRSKGGQYIDISIKSSADSLCEQCNLYLILIALILKDRYSVQYSFCSIQIIFFLPLISSTFIYLLITLIYSVHINDEQRDATCKNIVKDHFNRSTYFSLR